MRNGIAHTFGRSPDGADLAVEWKHCGFSAGNPPGNGLIVADCDSELSHKCRNTKGLGGIVVFLVSLRRFHCRDAGVGCAHQEKHRDRCFDGLP